MGRNQELMGRLSDMFEKEAMERGRKEALKDLVTQSKAVQW